MTIRDCSALDTQVAATDTAFGYAGGAILRHPYVTYKTSNANTLTSMQANSSYSVGDKCYGIDGSFYLECVTAGTTGNLYPDNLKPLAFELVNQIVKYGGTAEFKYRAYHGWACPPGGGWANEDTGYHSIRYVPSTYSNVSSGSFAANLTARDPNAATVSCSELASGKLSIYAVGAEETTDDPTYGSARGPNASLVRGFTLGRPKTNSVSSTSGYTQYGAIGVPYGVRLYDCYLTSNRIYTEDGGGASIYGFGHLIDCTVRNNSNAPSCLLGSSTHYGSTLMALGTTFLKSTLGAVPTPVVGAITYYSGFNHYPSGGSPEVIGGDTAGVASGTEFFSLVDNDPVETKLTYYPGSVISGIKANAYTHVTGRRPVLTQFSVGSTPYEFVTDGELETVQSDLIRSVSPYRDNGPGDGQGQYSAKTIITNSLDGMAIWFYNTKIDESFVVMIDVAYVLPAGLGITSLCSDDLWLDCVYLAETSNKRGGFASSRSKYDCPGLIYNSGAVNAIPTSSEAWTGLPANSIKGKLKVLITPRQVGPVQLIVSSQLCPWTRYRFTGTSLDLYICPYPTTEAAP